MTDSGSPPNGVLARIASLEEGARESRQRTGSSLGVMASWAGVVLAIVGSIGGIVSVSLRRELDRLDSERKDLDARVQREMRDLDAGAEKLTTSRTDDNARRIGVLEIWQQTHESDASGRFRAHDERLRSLERSAYEASR